VYHQYCSEEKRLLENKGSKSIKLQLAQGKSALLRNGWSAAAEQCSAMFGRCFPAL